ncbi:MAG: HindIII family type II restriction endonuclease, partial [Bacteroidales bacterium]|nr:HindIII family type II restriction endonuclease [Bacteroidales bacterium]
QIYHQATSRNVCIFTYSHLSLLLTYSETESRSKAKQLLQKIFQTVPALNPSKNSNDYWLAINRTMFEFSRKIENLWNIEKEASIYSINIAKEEALTFLAQEREKIMRMSHQEALKELIKVHKIDNKIRIINAISDNGLFTVK